MDINRVIPLMPDMAVFVTVVDTGNFTKAAALLGVTPSAVSRQIGRLEEALAVKLLIRTTRKLALTDPGKVTYDYCKQMYESAQEAVQVSSSAASSPAGTLRVSAPKALANQLLKPFIRPFLALYPDIQLQLKATDRFIDPVHDNIDIIFHITEQPIEGLINKVVGRVNQLLCASPEYLEQYGTPLLPLDLTAHNCIYLGETVSDRRWKFIREGHSATVNVSGSYAVNHSDMRLDALTNGLGIGFLPDFVAQQAISDGSLIEVLDQWQITGNYQGDICMQYAQSKFLPKANRVFIDYVSQQLTSR
ncbi:LysR family transcriptional regulator [Psychromonas ossibalaenae]|uniref:LysR family transcriptional regulator n=1 Tax=Psychromonas ossibalaenae TaxID=444922 RepID=UPI0003A9065A|nr:LysR family transcriptional regulator [Psychromonas ossibalaenae]